MLQWDTVLDFLPLVVLSFVVLVASLQIARKAGYGTGMVVVLSISPPIGLAYLAFAEWPIHRRLHVGRTRLSKSIGAAPDIAARSKGSS